MPDLTLEAEELRDAWHWFWRLRDDKGQPPRSHRPAGDGVRGLRRGFGVRWKPGVERRQADDCKTVTGQ
jgi:hypothetical protein